MNRLICHQLLVHSRECELTDDKKEEKVLTHDIRFL